MYLENNEATTLNNSIQNCAKCSAIYTNIGSTNFCYPQYHSRMELLYVVENSQDVLINGKDITLAEGNILIVNPYDLHEYKKSQALTFVCSIPAKYLSNFGNLTNHNKFATNVITNAEQTQVIYNLMLKIKEEKNLNDIIICANVMLLLGKLLDFAPLLNEQNKITYNLVIKVVEYIDTHYLEDIDLEDIARFCNYSKFYISKIFNKTYNANINDFINIKRLEAFVDLNKDNSNNISQKALGVGFNSARAFYDAFKKHYKTTPTNFFTTN
ncbi:MAG: AraC family transcriptional regulator [Clostridia bacterium]